MEKNQNVFVYYQGNPARGREIIAQLEALGGYNKYSLDGFDASCYYLIDPSSVIVKLSKDNSEWLTENYTELELESYKPADKELVWAWDDNWLARRDLVFYDAVDNTAFAAVGRRIGGEYDHYAPYKGELPEWAIESLKYMED